MSFVGKLVKAGAVPIYLVNFVDVNGKDVHFFVKSTQAKIDAFLRLTATSNFDLADYGEVLAGGFGKVPNEETRQIMKEKYDFAA